MFDGTKNYKNKQFLIIKFLTKIKNKMLITFHNKNNKMKFQLLVDKLV